MNFRWLQKELTESTNQDNGIYVESLFIVKYLIIGSLICCIFYLSLITGASRLNNVEKRHVEKAITLLGTKGYKNESFLLSKAATFRGSNNWLNNLSSNEDSHARTIAPLAIITLYPNFFSQELNDEQRAQILLFEAQQIQSFAAPLSNFLTFTN